jgi:hypothetical protein
MHRESSMLDTGVATSCHAELVGASPSMLCIDMAQTTFGIPFDQACRSDNIDTCGADGDPSTMLGITFECN